MTHRPRSTGRAWQRGEFARLNERRGELVAGSVTDHREPQQPRPSPSVDPSLPASATPQLSLRSGATTSDNAVNQGREGSCHTPSLWFSCGLSDTPNRSGALSPGGRLVADVARAIGLIRDVVRLRSRALSGAAAREFVTLFSEAERWRPRGWPCSPPRWSRAGSTRGLATDRRPSGSGRSRAPRSGAAKGRLAAAARAAQDPLLTEALHEGELSADQLEVVATALSESPRGQR